MSLPLPSLPSLVKATWTAWSPAVTVTVLVWLTGVAEVAATKVSTVGPPTRTSALAPAPG